MELSFLRRRLLNTTLDAPAPDGKGPAQPAYSITSTLGPLPLRIPDKTVIEYVGDGDEKKRHVAATIVWNWPSQARSYILINGQLMSLKEFMPRESGFMNSDSYVKIGDEVCAWHSESFNPQLYNTHGRLLISYVCDTFSFANRNPRAHVTIAPQIANDPAKRDVAVASLFVFKFCRDVKMPWQRKMSGPLPAPVWADEHASVGLTQEQVQALATTEKDVKEERRKAGDGLGDYVRLPDAEAAAEKA